MDSNYNEIRTMKSVLQLQLDNNYEIMRVAYTTKKESPTPLPSYSVKSVVNLQLREVPSYQVQQSTNWDMAWFDNYE
jgi:hypothetical protein